MRNTAVVMTQFLRPKFRPRPPLHCLCLPGDPLEARLKAIQEALASGEDPNELGGYTNPGVGRPLHYATDDSVQHDRVQMPQNLPVVKLLLESGADPRLPDLHGQTPIEGLEMWLRAYHKDVQSTWQPEMLELKSFFEAALETMKKAALALDDNMLIDRRPADHDVLKLFNRRFAMKFRELRPSTACGRGQRAVQKAVKLLRRVIKVQDTFRSLERTLHYELARACLVDRQMQKAADLFESVVGIKTYTLPADYLLLLVLTEVLVDDIHANLAVRSDKASSITSSVITSSVGSPNVTMGGAANIMT
ncbi:hypothetical protein OPT61_g4208 [Boeremia exigua]|uniref:Uncharacterized protein n=1 Tax=Boeremia exigua TaxID=749465 RepID=A0ACC2IF57_9PLEO|nr:hypothetical protein OPT61_g4208 [Boeremia exigua]